MIHPRRYHQQESQFHETDPVGTNQNDSKRNHSPHGPHGSHPLCSSHCPPCPPGVLLVLSAQWKREFSKPDFLSTVGNGRWGAGTQCQCRSVNLSEMYVKTCLLCMKLEDIRATNFVVCGILYGWCTWICVDEIRSPRFWACRWVSISFLHNGVVPQSISKLQGYHSQTQRSKPSSHCCWKFQPIVLLVFFGNGSLPTTP